MAGRFSVETIFKAIDRVTAPVSRMQNRVGKFTRSMSRGLRDVTHAFDRFGSGVRRAGMALLVAGAIASAGFGNVIRTGAEFEQAIVDVGAVSLQTRDQIAALEKQALMLGATTKFTSTQAANAMETMARAGFNAQEILAATPAVLNAAAASGLEIAETANHVSNVLKGMGLEASEAARVADVLALASARTNSTIGSLGESMSNVASTARQLNVPLEDVVASVALLQDVGLDASVAGSALNVMLTQMAVPSEKLQGLMRRLGVTFKDAKGNMLPLSDVIQQLSKASDALGGNFDKVAFLAELVGLRGQKAAANLVHLFDSGKLSTLSAELRNAEGSAARMAAIKMDTLIGSWTLLLSAIDAVKVKAFGLTDGPLKQVVDQMRDWVGANEDLIASKIGNFLLYVANNFEKIIKTTVKLAKMAAVIWGVVTALKALSLVLTIVNTLMLMNPIGLIITAIALLIISIAAVVIWFEELHAWFESMSFEGKAAFLALGGPLALLVAFGPKILAAWEPIKEFFVDLVTVFRDLSDLLLAINTLGIMGRFNNPFGGDEGDTSQAPAPSPTVITQAQGGTIRGEVTIRDESGRAEVTKPAMGLNLNLQQSGAF